MGSRQREQAREAREAGGKEARGDTSPRGLSRAGDDDDDDRKALMASADPP